MKMEAVKPNINKIVVYGGMTDRYMLIHYLLGKDMNDNYYHLAGLVDTTGEITDIIWVGLEEVSEV